jgi:acetyl esterase/lipase
MAKPRVTIDEGVVYGRELRCDVYTPEERDGLLPGVLLIHGGGWREGDRTQLRGYGVLIGREGYVCVAPEYRLVPEAPWPAQIDDVCTALRWMLDHADELGIDPERIAVEGNSAGAHLALLLAADESLPVRACIAVYPPTHLVYGEHVDGSLPLIAIADDGGSLELEREVSPLLLASPRFPPTKLIHGSGDDVVPVSASFRMYEALHAHGVPVDLHIYAEQPHAFDREPLHGRATALEMVHFLSRYV